MGVVGLDCPGMAEGLYPDQEEEDVALRDASVEIPVAAVAALVPSA